MLPKSWNSSRRHKPRHTFIFVRLSVELPFVCIAVTKIDRDSTKERCDGTADAKRSDVSLVLGRKEDLALSWGKYLHCRLSALVLGGYFQHGTKIKRSALVVISNASRPSTLPLYMLQISKEGCIDLHVHVLLKIIEWMKHTPRSTLLQVYLCYRYVYYFHV